MARYTKNGKGYASVTQILDIFYPFNKEGFAKWAKSQKLDHEKITRDSARMGSKVSEWIENHTLGITAIDSPPTIDYERGLRKAVDRFVETYEILNSEQTVYCDEYGYAGTYDMEVLIDDQKVLCDSKTYGAWKGLYKRDSGKIKKVTMQTSMYAYARPTFSIKDKLALVVFKTDGTYEIEELKYTDSWKDKITEHKDEIMELVK